MLPLRSRRKDLQRKLPVDGILARVPAQYVGRAQNSLRDAALVPDHDIRVEVDAGWLGRVRLTFRKYRCSPRGPWQKLQ